MKRIAITDSTVIAVAERLTVTKLTGFDTGYDGASGAAEWGGYGTGKGGARGCGTDEGWGGARNPTYAETEEGWEAL